MGNIPVISLCDCDALSKYIDVVIPVNNRSPQAIGLVYWFLTREVMHLKGKLNRDEDWEVMPDLFFYRNQEEIKKQEEDERKASDEVEPVVEAADADYSPEAAWDGDAAEPAAAGAAAADNWAATDGQANQDWAQEATNTAGDWAN